MIRNSLSAKILLLGLLNLLLLVVVFGAFARLQLRLSLSSFLLTPARERIVSVSRLIALELPDNAPSQWNRLLDEYGKRYPAQFYLFDHTGRELAGAKVDLPSAFLQAVKRDPFEHHHPERRGAVEHTLGPEAARSRPWQRREDQSTAHGEPPDSAFGRHGPMFAAGIGPGMNHGLGAPMGSEASLALMRTSNPTRYWVGVRIPVWRETDPEPIHATLVWQIRSIWTEPFFVDYRPWLGAGAALIIVSVVCWLPLIRGLSRSIAHLTTATEQISNGHFEITLPIKRSDEVGRLSESINRMAKRLSGLVYGQKRFLSDIAHELSSPIARMQFGLGILEQRATADALPYVADVREEVEHMSSLVSELLTFSKSQMNSDPKELREVMLAPLVERVLARERADNATVDVRLDEGMAVWAEPECLFRALCNIVRNAVRYAGAAGPIEVTAQRDSEQVAIHVMDHGPGVPEDELENLFRPFYRPEFARQRETGGTGLGLAIVRDCVEACGGTVHCRNRQPVGFEVQITVPAAPSLSGALQL